MTGTDDKTTRRPWWKKKRWIAALALWLLVVYPLSMGPWAYGERRGWWPSWFNPALGVLYAPLAAADRWEPWGREMDRYVNWWYDLAGSD